MSNISLSLTYFLESVNSDVTKETYKGRLGKFQEFIGKDFDDIIKMEPSEITKYVTMFIIEIKKNLNPNSIPTYIAPIRSFCEVNDVMLNWKKIIRFYPRKVKQSGQSAWQTSDLQTMLRVTTKLSTRAMIHVLASTGCRVGGVVDLKLKDIRDVDHGCKMVKVYADDIEEYTTFLTPEASVAVEEYLEKRRTDGENITPESYLFRQLHHDRPLNRVVVSMIIQRVAHNANLRGSKKGGRYGVQMCHGFRKRFNTILKENNQVNDNAIEKMLGHKRGLDGTYLQITDERLLEHFMKGVADLTVSEDHRLRLELNELEREKQELENKFEARLEKLEKERNVVRRKFVDDPEELQNV